MRRILSVVLCVCALLSVMAVAASAAAPPAPETSAPAETTAPKSGGDQIMDTWEKIKPFFTWIYQNGLLAISRGLVVAFEWLLSAVGLNFWQGGLFGALT
jgi:hypothetical protein